MDIQNKNSEKFLRNFNHLIDWSLCSFSDLPWRKHRTIYTTLLSELMLQQTTVSTVIPKFQNFLQRYPTWSSLAQASLEDILALWSGLGYYVRARRLYQIVQQYPEEDAFLEALVDEKKIAGIGPYTQGALLSIGLNRPAKAYDANISRIFLRYSKNASERENIYDELLRSYAPRDLNESLMDLGRTFCTATQARCSACFLQESCQSAFEPIIKTPAIKKDKISLQMIRLIVCKKREGFLGYLKSPEQWLHGYLELPMFFLDELINQTQIPKTQYPFISTDKAALLKLKSSYFFETRQSITSYKLEILNLVLKEEDIVCLEEANISEFLESCSYFGIEEKNWASSTKKIFSYLETLGKL